MTLDATQKDGSVASTRDGWLGVASIAAGTFLLVTTEFLPIGLLSRLAQDLQVSEGVAGLSVTAPGLIAAFAAPVLVLLVGTLNRRLVIVLLTSAVILSCAISAMAESFAIFLFGRLILGIAVGGLWSFAVAVGRRLVVESEGARVTAIISAGISAGTIVGMPVGALMGELIGWRLTFAANALLGILVVLAQLRFLPRLAIASAIDLGRLRAFAQIPMARVGLFASGLVAAGHFIAYTFLDPYLRSTVALNQSAVAMALAGYALAGIAGAFIGERLAVGNIHRAFVTVSMLLGASVLLVIIAAEVAISAVAMVMLWGLAFGAVPVCVQIWMYTASPRLYEAGSSLMVSAFQISIAAGATLGGLLVDQAGVTAAYFVSALVIFGGGAAALLSRPSVLIDASNLQAEK